MKPDRIKTTGKPLTPELLHKLDAWWRAATYLSVGQIYLYNNPPWRAVSAYDTIN